MSLVMRVCSLSLDFWLRSLYEARACVLHDSGGWVVGYGEFYDEYDDNDNNELSTVAAPLG